MISIICKKIIEKHESKSNFKQQLMKPIKKMVNIDQFLNSRSVMTISSRAVPKFVSLVVFVSAQYMARVNRNRARMDPWRTPEITAKGDDSELYIRTWLYV